jgi:hypothetical protein
MSICSKTIQIKRIGMSQGEVNRKTIILVGIYYKKRGSKLEITSLNSHSAGFHSGTEYCAASSRGYRKKPPLTSPATKANGGK